MNQKMGESSQVWIDWHYKGSYIQTAVINVRLLPGDKHPRISLDNPGIRWIKKAAARR
jgi:hypothetical protein